MPERFWRNISTHCWQDAAVQHGAKRRGCHRHLLYSISVGNAPLLYCSLWHLWFREIGADSRISMIRIGIVACDIVAITSHKHVEWKTRKHTHELWNVRSLHSKMHIPRLKTVYHNVSLPTFLSVSSAPSVSRINKKHGAKAKVESVKWSWSIQNPRKVLFSIDIVSWVRRL